MWIIRNGEDNWEAWYCGFDPEVKGTTNAIGYMTSSDGVQWSKEAGNPVIDRTDRQDPAVVKHNGTYYLYVESNDRYVDLFLSPDGVQYTPYDGNPILRDRIASPVVWVEEEPDGAVQWYMLYEDMIQDIKTIALAFSEDGLHWTEYPDNPVLTAEGSAVPDDIYKDLHSIYHLYYHQHVGGDWPSFTATSMDLVHWNKCRFNPIHHESSLVMHSPPPNTKYIIWHHRGDKKYYLYHK